MKLTKLISTLKFIDKVKLKGKNYNYRLVKLLNKKL